MANPVQYIIMNPELPMGEGKARAQAAHASVEGLRCSAKEPWGNPWDSTIVNRWYQGGHYAKIVLASTDLFVAEHYINDRGFKSALIIDEGRTELDPLTPTAIGVEILDKDMPHVRETFSVFKLYPSKPPGRTEEQRQRLLGYLDDPKNGLPLETEKLPSITNWWRRKINSKHS